MTRRKPADPAVLSDCTHTQWQPRDAGPCLSCAWDAFRRDLLAPVIPVVEALNRGIEKLRGKA